MKHLRFQYSVLDVCKLLSGDEVESSDALNKTERGRMLRWLRWRVTRGWEDSLVHGLKTFDAAVRMLAIALLHDIDVRAGRR